MATENIASVSVALLTSFPLFIEPCKAEWSPCESKKEMIAPSLRGHEDVDDLGAGGRGRQERELVAQLARVLDDADDGSATAVERQGRADPKTKSLGNPVGDGNLAGTLGVAAPAEGEELGAVRAVGILRPVVDFLDSTRERHGPVADDIGRPERLLRGVEPRLELSRIGRVEDQDVVGRSELAVVGRNRLVRNRDAADGSRDGDGQERQHDQLLAPFAAEHPPRPPDDCAASGDAAIPRAGQRRPVRKGRHRRSPAARSDSGPAGADVWSTTWPSRRKTTRSAQEANCAS